MSLFKRKTWIQSIMLLCIISLLVPVNAAGAAESSVKKVVLNEDALVIKGNTLVPVASVFKAFGASVQVPDNKTIKVATSKKKATLTIDSKVIWVDGKKTSYPIATQVINGKTMVPVKFAASFFKAKITVNKYDYAISLVNSDTRVDLNYNDLYELSQQYAGKTAWVSVLAGSLSYYSGTSVPASALPPNLMKVKIKEIKRSEWLPSSYMEIEIWYGDMPYYLAIKDEVLNEAVHLSNPKVTYGISNAQWNSLQNYSITTGMTKSMLWLVYGSPDRTSNFTNADGYVDMWLYSYKYSGYSTIYTFINGYLYSISRQ